MYQSTIKVRFGELDPYNHVNHAVYAAYLEAGRTDAMEASGVAIQDLSERGWNMVVTDLVMKFRAPARAGDVLVIETSISQLGAITSRWSQRIMRGDQVLVEGEIRAGAVDADGRPKRMSPEVIALFRPLLNEDRPGP